MKLYIYDKLESVVTLTWDKGLPDSFSLKFKGGSTRYTKKYLGHLVGKTIGVDKHGNWWAKE